MPKGQKGRGEAKNKMLEAQKTNKRLVQELSTLEEQLKNEEEAKEKREQLIQQKTQELAALRE